MSIVDLKFTLSLSPPPDFTRLGKFSNGYFWFRKSSVPIPDLAPITDICVLFDDEVPPSDFVKLADELPGGVFLGVSRNSGNSPVTELKLVSDEEAIGEGFEKLKRDLSRSSNPTFLAFKTKDGVLLIVFFC